MTTSADRLIEALYEGRARVSFVLERDASRGGVTIFAEVFVKNSQGVEGVLRVSGDGREALTLPEEVKLAVSVGAQMAQVVEDWILRGCPQTEVGALAARAARKQLGD